MTETDTGTQIQELEQQIFELNVQLTALRKANSGSKRRAIQRLGGDICLVCQQDWHDQLLPFLRCPDQGRLACRVDCIHVTHVVEQHLHRVRLSR